LYKLYYYYHRRRLTEGGFGVGARARLSERAGRESQVYGIENGTILSGPNECHPRRRPRGPTHKPPVAER